MSSQTKILFVCLGNICRSPIAEAVFLHEIKQQGREKEFMVDSAALGSWHIGKLPDKRALETLKKHNVPYNNRARQINSEDFHTFDYIFGMDDENIRELNYQKPKNSNVKIELLGEYDPEGEKIIRDPYYDSGSEGFEKCYQQCVRCIKAFLSK